MDMKDVRLFPDRGFRLAFQEKKVICVHQRDQRNLRSMKELL